MKETDWLLNQLRGNLGNNYADIKQSGYEFKLGKNENYWKLDEVRNNPLFLDEKGEPSKRKFDDYYNSVLESYNTYKKEDFNILQFQEAKGFDTPSNRRMGIGVITNPIDIKQGKQVYNPLNLTTGFVGPNELSRPTKSVMELAQHNEYFDVEANKFVKLDSNIGGILDPFTLPTLVLAKDENGLPKVHPETGRPYLETLAGRDPSDKEILTWENMLTEEDSFLNKYTPLGALESDDLEKSAGSTILKETIKWAPALIPGVGTYYLSALAAKTLVDIGLEYGKTIDQVITGKDKDDKRYKNVNEAMGILGKLSTGVSESAKENPFNFEGITSMISNIGLDLGAQFGVMNMSSNLAKMLKADPKTFGTTGQIIYNAGLANKEMMDIADRNNLTPSDRALLSLATTAAFSALYKLSPFEKLVEKSYSKNLEDTLIRKAIRDYAKPINETLEKLKELPDQAKQQGYYNLMKDVAKNVFKKSENWLKELSEDGANSVMAGAISEGIEETSEVFLSEGIKELYNSLYSLFGTTKDKEGKDFKFKDLWGKEFGQELVLSALGGSIAGAGFKIFDRIKNPTPPSKELIQLIQEGKTDLILKQVDKMEEKGLFAPKDLSVEPIEKEGNILWKPSNKNTINQNKFVSDLIRREVIKNDNFIKTLNADKFNIDLSENIVKSAFNNFINTELHTSLRKDALDLTNKIIEQKKKIENLKSQLGDDDVINQSINLQLKQEEKIYNDLQKQIKENLIDEDGKFENLDKYVRQALFGTLPYITKNFGLKTKNDFLKKDGTLDEQSYKDYLYNQRIDDINKAIKDYDNFLNNDNVKKINNLTQEDFDNYFKNIEVEENLEKLDDIDNYIDSLKDFKVDEDLLKKYDTSQINQLEDDLKILNKNIEYIENLIKDNNIDLQTLEDNFKSLKNQKESIEQDLQKEEFADYFSIFEEEKNKLEDKIKLFETIKKFDIEKQRKTKSKLENEINKILNSKKHKIFTKLSKLQKTNTNKKLDDLFSDIKNKLNLTKELSKDTSNFSTQEIIDDLEKFKSLVKKYSAYVYSLRTINPSMNNFRKTEQAKKYLKDNKLSIVDTVIDKKTHDLLQTKLSDYISRIDKFIEIAEDNKKNKLKYIIHDQIVQSSRIKNRLKKEFSLNTDTKTIDELEVRNSLLNPDEDSDKIASVYKELSELFKEVKNLIKDKNIKIENIKGLEYYQTKDDELSNEELVNLLIQIERGNYDDFLARLRNLLNDENNYAPFYFQESALFQLFSKLQNPTYQNPFLKDLKTEYTFFANNLSIVDIKAGGGKTQQILKNLTQLDENKSFIYFTPRESQGDIIDNYVKENNIKNVNRGGTFDDLEKLLFGDKQIVLPDNIIIETNSDNVAVPKIEYLDDKVIVHYIKNGKEEKQEIEKPKYSKELENYSAIILDEATHANPILLYWLNKLYPNKPVIATCDTTQLGKTLEGYYAPFKSNIQIDWNLETIIAERTPKQSFSVRNRYTGVPEATQALYNLYSAKEIQSDSSEKSFARIKDKESYQVPVQYTTNGDFIGFFVDEDEKNLDRFLNLIKGVDRNKIAFITNDLAKDKPKYESIGQVFTYDEIQGQEFDYVFILSDKQYQGNYKTHAYLKQLYTLVSRAKKATYYNKPKNFDYQISFNIYKELEKIELTIPLDNDTIQKYKDFKKKSLSNFTTTTPSPKVVLSDEEMDEQVFNDVQKISDQQISIDGEIKDNYEDDSPDNYKNEFVRLFSWYNNKTRAEKLGFNPEIIEKQGKEYYLYTEDKLTILKNAIFFSQGIQEQFDEYLKYFGITDKYDISNLQYKLELIDWKENDVLAKGATQFKPEFLEGVSPKQMLISASFDNITIDLLALPLIDDFRKNPAKNEFGSGEALLYYKNKYGSEIFDILVELREKLINNNNEIILNKDLVNKLFNLKNRGRGKIFKDKEQTFTDFIDNHPAVKISKPFVITQGFKLKGRPAVLYTYNKDIDLSNDESDLSALFEKWYNSDKNSRTQVGLLLLDNIDKSILEIIKEYENRGNLTDSEFIAYLESVTSNDGIIQLMQLVHALLKDINTSNPTVATFLDEFKTNSLLSKISDELDEKEFLSIETAKLDSYLKEKFFDNLSGTNRIFEKIKILPILKLFHKIKKENAETIPLPKEIDRLYNNIQTGLGVKFKKTANRNPKNKIAFIEPTVKTKARISPIEISLDLRFFKDLLNITEDNEFKPTEKTNQEVEKTSINNQSEEEITDEVILDETKDTPKDVLDITEEETQKDLTIKDEIINKEVEEFEEDYADFSSEIKTLEDILNFRFKGIYLLYEFTLDRLYRDIIRPNTFIDFEKGTFIKAKDVNKSILAKKLELISNLAKKIEGLTIEYDKNSIYTINDFLDLDISNEEKIEKILNNRTFNDFYSSQKPEQLFKKYLLEKENKSEKELEVIIDYVDYTILNDFDKFIKYDTNLKSLIKKEKNKYIRKNQDFFEKGYDEDIAIEKFGTSLFINIINNLPLLTKTKEGYIQVGFLQYAKVLNLIDEIKSHPFYSLNHDSLKFVILEKARKEEDPAKRNIYNSLYLFLYNDSDFEYIDRYNKKRTNKSLDSIVSNNKSTLLRLFHSAIENVFVNTNRNYFVSINKQNDSFLVEETKETFKEKSILIDKSNEYYKKLKEDLKFDETEIGLETLQHFEDKYLIQKITGIYFITETGDLTKYGEYFISIYGNSDRVESINLLKKFLIESSNKVGIVSQINKMITENKPVYEIQKFVQSFKKESKFKKLLFETSSKKQVTNISKFKEIIDDFEVISKIINAVDNTEIKSVLINKEGNAVSKFSSMTNTNNFFQRVKNSPQVFKKDLIDKLTIASQNEKFFVGIKQISLNDGVKAGSLVKPHKRMNKNEILYSLINPYYYENLAKNLNSEKAFINSKVYFFPYVGSDSNKEHILSIDLNEIYRVIGKNENLSIDNMSLKQRIDLIEQAFYDNERSYYLNLEKILVEDFKKAEKELNQINNTDVNISNIDDIQKLIVNLTEEEVTNLLYNKGVNVIRGIHYFKKGIREDLINKINLVKNYKKDEFIKIVLGDKDDLKTTDLIYGDAYYLNLLPKNNAKKEIAKYKKLEKDNLYKDFYENNNVLIQVNNKIKINPLDYIFLLENLVVNLPFARRISGDIIQYKGNSIGKSFVENVKRNKMGVSTFMSYYTDLIKNPEGINRYSNIAIIEDPTQVFKSLINKPQNKDYADGATFTLHFAQLKKEISLGGKIGFNPGIHHKSVGVNYDQRTGAVSFQKHNDFTITNEMIRNSYGTKYDWQKYIEQMLSSIQFDEEILVNEKSIYYDVEKDEVVESKPFIAKNMLDIWKGLGGAYTVKEVENGDIKGKYTFTTIKDSNDISRLIHKIEIKNFLDNIKVEVNPIGEFSYNNGIIYYKSQPVSPLDLDDDEYSLYKLFLNKVIEEKKKVIELAQKKSIKGKYIESISFISAVKTGQVNINTSQEVDNKYLFNKGKSLRFMKFDNTTRGIQLASEKSVEESEATLPAQLINATAFGGYTFDKSQKIFNYIKELSLKSIDKKLVELVKKNELKEQERIELINIIRDFLKNSIEEKTVTQLTKEIINYSKTPSFDNRQIVKILLSSFNSYLTKEGIKKKLKGAMLVIKPPTQIYEVDGKIMQGYEYRLYKKQKEKEGIILDVKPRDLKKAELKLKTDRGFIPIEEVSVLDLKNISKELNIKSEFEGLSEQAIFSELLRQADKETTRELENRLQRFINQLVQKDKTYWQATKGEMLAPSLWKRMFYINNNSSINQIKSEDYFKNKVFTNIKAAYDFFNYIGLSDENLINSYLSDESFKFTKEQKQKLVKKLAKGKYQEVKNKKQIKEELLNSFSEMKREQFSKSNQFVTQRIPLQSLASVMVNEIVGFIHTEENTIMLNNDHQILTGGDYDVDKTTIIGYNLNKPNDDIENQIIDSFIDLVNDPRNIIVREKAINVDYLSQISDNYTNNSISLMSNYSLMSKVSMKYDNMLGKEEIGIFATGLKVLSGITASYYKTLELYKSYQDKDKKELFKSILKIPKLTIKIERDNNTSTKTYSMPANLNLDILNEETINFIVKELYSGKSLKELRNELNLQDKAFDILGELLNLATDNAKELKLGGLNSTMTTAPIYSLGSILGIPTEDIAYILNQKNVKSLLETKDINFYSKDVSNLDAVYKNLESKDENLKSFKLLYDKTKEFRIISKLFSINQGLKSDNFAIFQFEQMLIEYMKSKSEKNDKLKKMAEEFDLVRFIENLKGFDDWLQGKEKYDSYSLNYIKEFDKVKDTFNPLYLIAINPHTRAQYEIFASAEKVYRNTALRLNNIKKLLMHFHRNNFIDINRIDEKTFNKLNNIFDNLFIDEFLQKYSNQIKVFNEKGNLFNLANEEDRKEFIRYAEEVFFPALKADPKLMLNEFINNLIEDVDYDIFGKKYTFWKMNENHTDLSNSSKSLKYTSLSLALKSLKNKYIQNNSIYNVLRLYNMLVHRDSLRERAFTRFFDKNDAISIEFNNFLHSKIINNPNMDFSYIDSNEKFVHLLISNNILSISDAKEFEKDLKYINPNKVIMNYNKPQLKKAEKQEKTLRLVNC